MGICFLWKLNETLLNISRKNEIDKVEPRLEVDWNTELESFVLLININLKKIPGCHMTPGIRTVMMMMVYFPILKVVAKDSNRKFEEYRFLL